jgi:hypothetical protein
MPAENEKAPHDVGPVVPCIGTGAQRSPLRMLPRAFSLVYERARADELQK